MRRGRSPRTIQSYREPAGQLADCCKGSDLLVLDRGDIETFLIEVRELHSPSTELDSLGIQRQDRPGRRA